MGRAGIPRVEKPRDTLAEVIGPAKAPVIWPAGPIIPDKATIGVPVKVRHAHQASVQRLKYLLVSHAAPFSAASSARSCFRESRLRKPMFSAAHTPRALFGMLN